MESIEIDGTPYYSATEVAKSVGVSRQTLWRWRNEGKVPAGMRYRDRQVVFTKADATVIQDYATRLVPAKDNNQEVLRR